MHADTDATADANGPPPSFFASVRDALRGVRHDYTQGPIGRAILLLAVPMVAEMAMESIFAVVDIWVVSHLGPDAVATVGLTESMLTILYAVAMGLSMGALAIVARRIGEKDPERASIAAVQAILLGLFVAVPVALVGVIFARPLLAAMGGTGWILEHGVGYARLMFASTVSIVLLFLINAIFRGSGDAAISMRTLWLANAINIVLAPSLVLGLGPFPRLGILGAALATTTGRSAGVLYQLYRLTRGDARTSIARRHLRLDLETMGRMARLAVNGVGQALISMTSWVGLVRIISTFGNAAVAGYTISIRIVMFALLPSWGMSNAAATLVGQSLGAGKPERGEVAVRKAGTYNMIFLGVVGALFIVLAGPIVDLFNPGAEVVPHAVRGLRIVSAGFLFYAWGMVFTAAFNGAGDTATPTLLNLVCFWLFEIPVAYALAIPLGFGPSGVYASVAVAFSVLASVSAVLFRRGKWKTRRV